MIHKQQPSSFTGTDLDEHLKKLGKKKVVLAGMLSSPCALCFSLAFNIES